MAERLDVAQLVALEVTVRAPGERGAFLRSLMAHASAELVAIEGQAQASEHLYRMADAVVAVTPPPGRCGGRGGPGCG